MIFVDAAKVVVPNELRNALKAATKALANVKPEDRSDFFKKNRDKTWGDPALVAAYKKLIGNKCWYSEVDLAGADPNVDHFRPKGRVVEVDDSFSKTGEECEGYWWLAFEPLNYRLSCQHSNQRRVDEHTDGGKADFFPVKGSRTPTGTSYLGIFEDVLPLDPCVPSDVSLIWFDPDGNPCCSPKKKRSEEEDKLRIQATIWLYHLDKHETAILRAKAVAEVRRKLEQADSYHQLWNSTPKCLKSKSSFNREVAEIADLLKDSSSFAGAKRCIVRLAMADYEWIDSCQALLI